MSQISFPVYRLQNKKPNIENGVISYSTIYKEIDTGMIHKSTRIVDDINIPFNTLSRRRLELLEKDAILYKPKKVAYFLGDFIRLAKAGCWFIDSTGYLFKYTKTIKARLIFRKIVKVIPSNGLGSIIEVEGLPQRFKTMYIISANDKYVGLLKYNGIHILYGTFDKLYKESWRKI